MQKQAAKEGQKDDKHVVLQIDDVHQVLEFTFTNTEDTDNG